ncbi:MULTISPECIES: DNA recombination protein RmuC [Thalassotalea]|uniref:DNA recombination protein RmuC n=1 Tax=Thalassotalea TaxID=1518149 RepID=UPI000945AAC8|nr:MULTISPECIES: DNA recombination protein RmuC [Thalassotalea]OKY25331.1 recombinase RmuC [Thalassotalea sp. PP2-459]
MLTFILDFFQQLSTSQLLFSFSCLFVSLLIGIMLGNINGKASREQLKTLLQQHMQLLIQQQQQLFSEHKFAQHQLFSEQATLQQQQARDDAHMLQSMLHKHQQDFTKTQTVALEQLLDVIAKHNQSNREEQAKSLTIASDKIANKVSELTGATDNRLKEISEQVEKRLADGFEKTSKTFSDIVKRLALIDDAQKKITELSSNVVSLQEVLSDKRSRGAFGEVQLSALIRNVLPEQHFSLQHTLSNNRVADCILWLPEPTGNVVIDAKFPLENYKVMTDIHHSDLTRKAAERQFKADIKKHINDISSKYLIDGETADGAIMFIPAEAIFAEIHRHFPDLVEHANNQRVWLTSPTTLMAVLTTARAVLKDEATREQVHIIKAHLGELSADFSRFKLRFNNLARHIDQASVDVKQIHTSADKISARFDKIEQVDLSQEDKLKAQLLHEKTS